jgi:hypothetical protein
VKFQISATRTYRRHGGFIRRMYMTLYYGYRAGNAYVPLELPYVDMSIHREAALRALRLRVRFEPKVKRERSGQKSDAIPLALKRVLMSAGCEFILKESRHGHGIGSARRGAARQGRVWVRGYLGTIRSGYVA